MILGLTLKQYIMFNIINIIVILLIVRIFYYALIAKVDPIKAVGITWPKKIINWMKQEKSKELKNSVS